MSVWREIGICTICIIMYLLGVVVGASGAEEVKLPSHDDDEHSAEHYLMIAATLFPEEVVAQIEQEFLATPCRCGCDQMLVDCGCVLDVEYARQQSQ